MCAVAAYIGLALFETPGWCVQTDGHLRPECSDATALAKTYGTYGWPALPPRASIGLECTCIALFCASLAARVFCVGRRPALRSPALIMQAALLGVAALDVACTASPMLWRRTHFTRPMRALFIVLAHRRRGYALRS